MKLADRPEQGMVNQLDWREMVKFCNQRKKQVLTGLGTWLYSLGRANTRFCNDLRKEEHPLISRGMITNLGELSRISVNETYQQQSWQMLECLRPQPRFVSCYSTILSDHLPCTTMQFRLMHHAARPELFRSRLSVSFKDSQMVYGVLIDSYTTHAWAASHIRSLGHTEDCQVHLISQESFEKKHYSIIIAKFRSNAFKQPLSSSCSNDTYDYCVNRLDTIVLVVCHHEKLCLKFWSIQLYWLCWLCSLFVLL